MSVGVPSSSSSSLDVVERCLVCDDISSGYHYGVPSCNGCKTFFRRVIMRNQTFTCQYDNNCQVDKSVRCACRHCRFQKCLRVGMDRNAIQQNRDPIGYTKRTRRYAVIRKDDTENESGGTSEHMALIEQLTAHEKDCALLRNSALELKKSIVDLVQGPALLLNRQFLEEHSAPAHSTASLRPVTHLDYQYWHDRDWTIMIEWSKTLPCYPDLPLVDKLAMLRHNTVVFPALMQCFHTPNEGPDTIVFPNGAYFDRTPELTRPAGFNKKKYQLLDGILGPFRQLGVDISEFAAFKAINFLNPDADGLSPESKEPVHQARQRVTHALYKYMVHKVGVERAGDRFGELLMITTTLATMAVEMRETVVVADFFDQIRFSPFARQLLLPCRLEELVAGKETSSSPAASDHKYSPSTDDDGRRPTNSAAAVVATPPASVILTNPAIADPMAATFKPTRQLPSRPSALATSNLSAPNANSSLFDTSNSGESSTLLKGGV